MKHCTICNELKPLSDYYNDKRRSDGKRSRCKKCHIEMTNRWQKDNWDKLKVYHKKRNSEKKEHIRSTQREYERKQRANSVDWRIKKNLRCRLYYALKSNQKQGSAIDDLGCSIEKLKIHLESKFLNGMSWENYGEWHIDHIKPLSLFDLTNKKELKKACNYKNLQPLWAEDNIKKSNNYDGNL